MWRYAEFDHRESYFNDVYVHLKHTDIWFNQLDDASKASPSDVTWVQFRLNQVNFDKKMLVMKLWTATSGHVRPIYCPQNRLNKQKYCRKQGGPLNLGVYSNTVSSPNEICITSSLISYKMWHGERVRTTIYDNICMHDAGILKKVLIALFILNWGNPTYIVRYSDIGWL